MSKKYYYITLAHNKIEKLRLWLTEKELIDLIKELNGNYCNSIVFDKNIELKIIEEENGLLTSYYYDNINKIAVDNFFPEATTREGVKLAS